MCLKTSQTQREVWNGGGSALGRQNNKRKQRTWKSVEQEILWEQNHGEENLFLTKGDMMTNSAERGSIEDNPQAKFFQGGAFSGKMCPHLCLKEICLSCTFHCVWFEKKNDRTILFCCVSDHKSGWLTSFVVSAVSPSSVSAQPRSLSVSARP